MTTTLAVISIGLLIFLAHFFNALFEKTRIPDVLPLVLLGFFLGPVFGIVDKTLFNNLDSVFTQITIIIILFAGGIDLKLDDLKQSWLTGLKLTLTTYFTTLTIVAVFGMTAMGLPVLYSFILGSILAGTSFAITFPVTSKLRISSNAKAILMMESTITTLLSVVIALALIQMAKLQNANVGDVLGRIVGTFVMSSIIAAAATIFWTAFLSRVRELDNSIFLTPAFVIVLYGFVELLGFNGAIAALTFGFIAGNMATLSGLKTVQSLGLKLKGVEFNDVEILFFNEIVFVLKTFFFIYIGISINLGAVTAILLGLALTLLIFLIRIPAVNTSLQNAVNRFDISVIAIMAPKGLITIVLISIGAQQLDGYAEFMKDTVYSVVIFSIVLTAVLSFLCEKRKLDALTNILFSRHKPETQTAENPENESETDNVLQNVLLSNTRRRRRTQKNKNPSDG